MPTRPKFGDTQLLDQLKPAILVLGEALGIDALAAKRGLAALVQAGYCIAPREPTNAMLVAYLACYGRKATRHGTIIQGCAKARKRWGAMAGAGIAIALSWKGITRNGGAPAQGIAVRMERDGEAGSTEGKSPVPQGCATPNLPAKSIP